MNRLDSETRARPQDAVRAFIVWTRPKKTTNQQLPKGGATNMAKQNANARAVEAVTNSKILTRIAKISERICGDGFTPEGESRKGVYTVGLAAKILNNREMSKLVDWFAAASGTEEIADVIGTLIAASRISARA